jgi:putative (di)nucleoside polyphosphate hydrolase
MPTGEESAMSTKAYRQCVVAVFKDGRGDLLVGKRRGTTSGWQFPQGGVEDGEDLAQALRREVHEEIGCRDFKILESLESPIPYEFPPDLGGKLLARFRGQHMYWFLCELLPNHLPDLEKAIDQEFDALAWVSPAQAYAGIISWKKEAYAEGLRRLKLHG